MIELLVTISIVGILMTLMMPAFRAARDSAMKFVCLSNLRQVGMANYAYAFQWGDSLPPTIFDDLGSHYFPAETMALTTGNSSPWLTQDQSGQWDGLGVLLDESQMFLGDPRVLYCPCHHGAHEFSTCVNQLAKDNPTAVYSNYHYIGDDAIEIDSQGAQRTTTRKLYALDQESVIVVDGMRRASDVNHYEGTNTLKADMSVRYWSDGGVKTLLGAFPNITDDGLPPSDQTYRDFWARFSK